VATAPRFLGLGFLGDTDGVRPRRIDRA